MYQPSLIKEQLTGVGQFTTATDATAIAAADVVIKAAPGRLCRIIVTTATTAAQPITFYDNATAGSGKIIFIIPGAAAVATFYDVQMPCALGITIAKNTSLAAGAITISWI